MDVSQHAVRVLFNFMFVVVISHYISCNTIEQRHNSDPQQTHSTDITGVLHIARPASSLSQDVFSFAPDMILTNNGLLSCYVYNNEDTYTLAGYWIDLSENHEGETEFTWDFSNTYQPGNAVSLAADDSSIYITSLVRECSKVSVMTCNKARPWDSDYWSKHELDLNDAEIADELQVASYGYVDDWFGMKNRSLKSIFHDGSLWIIVYLAEIQCSFVVQCSAENNYDPKLVCVARDQQAALISGLIEVDENTLMYSLMGHKGLKLYIYRT